MAAWSDFHTDPRKSYYLFLRQEYQHTAHVAHARVKRIDRMIAELEGASEAPTSMQRLIETVFGAIATSVKRLWEHPHPGRWILGRDVS